VAQRIRRFHQRSSQTGHERPAADDTGPKSGKLRRTALVYARDGDRYILAASNSGADKHPAWISMTTPMPRSSSVSRRLDLSPIGGNGPSAALNAFAITFEGCLSPTSR
jgi:hypothetical protein